MAKFKVLKYNQTYMTHLGLYSNLNRLTEPTNELFKSFFYYYVSLTSAVSLFGGAAFIMENLSEVKASLGAFKIAFSAIQCYGMFLGIGLNVIIVKALHLKIQQIVDEVESNNELHNIYWECEQKCRKHTQRFGYFVIFHTSTFVIVLIYALVCIAFGNYDTSSWFLPFFLVLPFDGTRVSGWLMTWLTQFSMAFSYALNMTSITSYFVSCCYYMDAMFDHFNVLGNSVTIGVQRMQLENNRWKIKEIRKQITAQLSTMVKFHNETYEVFHMLKNIFSLVIFSLLPGNIVFMSISMYDVEMSVKNFEPSVLLFDLSCIICALFWPAFICYYASHTTDQIESIGDTVYNLNWEDYPLEVQKNVILTIAYSQQPVNFSGMGIIYCSVEAFGKLCNTSSSYYLMFRAIESTLN